MIVRGSLRLAGAGVLIGLRLAVAVTRLISEFLFGISWIPSRSRRCLTAGELSAGTWCGGGGPGGGAAL
jgi:hypothetical protein